MLYLVFRLYTSLSKLFLFVHVYPSLSAVLSTFVPVTVFYPVSDTHVFAQFSRFFPVLCFPQFIRYSRFPLYVLTRFTHVYSFLFTFYPV